MKIDTHLEKIIRHLKLKYKCHSILLYGSRARGDATKHSDYDVMGISSTQKKLHRIAKKENGVYWDVWVYPESKLKQIDESLLYMKNAIVLYEKNGQANKLITKINKLKGKGPKRLLKWERELKISWINKSFARAAVGDEEGNMRRYWILVGLLEDYFLLRGKWYLGSKESFAWLKKNEKKTYLLFCKVFQKPFNNKNLNKLIQIVTQNT